MIPLLSKTKHFIKLDNQCGGVGKLILKYRSFPYPPFNEYEIDHIDPNIIIKEYPDPSNIFVQEGGSVYHTKHFTFPNKGIYKICIKKLDNKHEDLIHCVEINVE